MIAGLRCNYPKDGPGFFAGSRSDGFKTARPASAAAPDEETVPRLSSRAR